MRAKLSSTTALALGATGVLTLVSWLALRGGPLNYDMQWALDWGAAILRGEAPEYDVDGAPTSHPLATLVAAGLHFVAGDHAPGGLHLLAHAAHALLVVVTALVAATLFSWPAGVVAGLAVALVAPISETSALAFQDPAAAALVLLALLLEVRRPGRAAAPLLVLALAGLLRPEVWGLAAAYWLWRAAPRPWRERLALGALAAAGPALWMLNDLVVTGEPLLSFTRTREGAEIAGRTTGLAEGPEQLLLNLRTSLDEPILAGAVAGGAIVLLVHAAARRAPRSPLAWPRRTGQLTLLALGVLLAFAFLVLAAGDLSLLERYVIGLVAVSCILFAFFVTGWRQVPPGGLRAGWAAAGVLLAIAAVALAPRQFDRLDATMAAVRSEGDVVEALGRLAEDPRTRAAVERCRVTSVYSYRVQPYLAYELDRAPSGLPITVRPAAMPGRVAWVAPATARALLGFALIGAEGLPVPSRPAGFSRVAGNEDWSLFTRGC